MAEFLMVVGNISPLWMYTTAKLAARHSLPSRADDARIAGKLPEKRDVLTGVQIVIVIGTSQQLDGQAGQSSSYHEQAECLPTAKVVKQEVGQHIGRDLHSTTECCSCVQTSSSRA